MKALEFNVLVTPDDVRVGHKGSCLLCPIALAIRRALWYAHVQVYATCAVINGQVLALPQEACDFVQRFDSGRVCPESFTPLEFRLASG